jgi:hypothetical protein
VPLLSTVVALYWQAHFFRVVQQPFNYSHSCITLEHSSIDFLEIRVRNFSNRQNSILEKFRHELSDWWLEEASLNNLVTGYREWFSVYL